MAYFRCGGGGVPSSLKTGMNAVLNKKMGTATVYAPDTWPDTVNLLGKLPERTASGALVHIEDGADAVPLKSLVADITPKGGNGTPSAPVAITGTTAVSMTKTGKNLLDVSTAQGTGTIWFYYDNGIKLKKGVTYTFSCGNYGTGSIAFYGLDHTTQVAYAYISASSANVTFTPTEDIIVCPRIYQSGLTVSELVDVMIEVGNAASAFEAYAGNTYNVQMPVGKNLWEFGDLDIQTTYISKELTTPLPAGDYVISGNFTSANGYCDCRFRKADGTNIVTVFVTAGGSERTSKTFTLTEPAYFAYCYSARGAAGYTATWENVQIEAGSAATPYVPYRTIFGGTVDVVNGTGTETWEKKVYTGAENEYWVLSKSGDVYRYYVINDNVKKPTGRGVVYSNIGQYSASGNDVGTCFTYFSSGINRVLIYYIPPQTIQTVEDFRVWLQSNNFEVAYEKATSQDFTLTPVPINSYLGVNNFWNDAGDTEVTYRRDIDLALAEQASNTRMLAAPLALGRTLDAIETTDENADAKEEQENELDR